MTKKTLIIGSAGQDGALLSELLTAKGYEVFGIKRNDLNILNPNAVIECIGDIKPTEIYYLAAFHHSSECLPPSNGDLFHKSMEIHFHAPVNFLDGITQLNSSIKFFFASSSHIFGSSGHGMHTEASPYNPQSQYAITKLAGMRACQHYRTTKNIFTSSGILYNHESILRKPSFLSKKIAIAVAEISKSGFGSIELSELDSQVDWGDARDTVDAIYRILQLNKADDYIVSTGKLHTVKNFIETAFEYVGLDYKDYLITKKKEGFRPPLRRLGDPSKLMHDSGWRPSIDFKTMVGDLVQYEINLIKNNKL